MSLANAGTFAQAQTPPLCHVDNIMLGVIVVIARELTAKRREFQYKHFTKTLLARCRLTAELGNLRGPAIYSNDDSRLTLVSQKVLVAIACNVPMFSFGLLAQALPLYYAGESSAA